MVSIRFFHMQGSEFEPHLGLNQVQDVTILVNEGCGGRHIGPLAEK